MGEIVEYSDDIKQRNLGQRLKSGLDRTEEIYLRILRGAILILATLLIIAAVVLAGFSIYKMLRSEDSVVEEVASVSPEDVSAASASNATVLRDAKVEKPGVDVAKKQFYDDFAKRYHRLFVAKFEPFRQAEDKRMSQAEFGDAFLNPAQRLEMISEGDLDFDQDRNDLETMLPVLTAAADLPQTRTALNDYRQAKKVEVCHAVQKTRYETRQGWDSYASNCANWYESPVGCSVIRSVEVPYTERQCAMQFPEGTRSHADLMRGHQDQFLKLLEERRAANSARATRARADIRSGNIQGQATLVTALQVLGGFLILMFFFLLIAIERHQRRIARELP